MKASGTCGWSIASPTRSRSTPARLPVVRYDTTLAGLFSQSLAGMVALTGQWWLEVRSPGEDEVAAHLVNLAWTASAISCTNLRCGSAPSRRTPFVVLFL